MMHAQKKTQLLKQLENYMREASPEQLLAFIRNVCAQHADHRDALLATMKTEAAKE